MDIWPALASHLELCRRRSPSLRELDVLQPILSYTTKTHTTFGFNTESTYDWHNSQWTIPINLTVAQLTKIGKMNVQFILGARVYADGPSGNADGGLRFTIQPLFPTAKPTPH